MSAPEPPTSTAELPTGISIKIRAVTADDKELFREGFRALSAESRMRRFLRAVVEPTEEMLRYLTEVDQQDHVAILAFIESPDLKTETPVGVARFVRLKDEPEVAEAAVTVMDAHQKLGVGRALLVRLNELARERGIRRFRCEVFVRNEPMRRILEIAGAKILSQDEETLVCEVELGGQEAKSGLWAVFRELVRGRS